MTATIHYLRQAVNAEPAGEEPAPAARDFRPQPKSALPGKKRAPRNPLPCGRNSGWKKPIGGNAVRRKK